MKLGQWRIIFLVAVIMASILVMVFPDIRTLAGFFAVCYIWTFFELRIVQKIEIGTQQGLAKVIALIENKKTEQRKSMLKGE